MQSFQFHILDRRDEGFRMTINNGQRRDHTLLLFHCWVPCFSTCGGDFNPPQKPSLIASIRNILLPYYLIVQQGEASITKGNNSWDGQNKCISNTSSKVSVVCGYHNGGFGEGRWVFGESSVVRESSS